MLFVHLTVRPGAGHVPHLAPVSSFAKMVRGIAVRPLRCFSNLNCPISFVVVYSCQLPCPAGCTEPSFKYRRRFAGQWRSRHCLLSKRTTVTQHRERGPRGRGAVGQMGKGKGSREHGLCSPMSSGLHLAVTCSSDAGS